MTATKIETVDLRPFFTTPAVAGIRWRDYGEVINPEEGEESEEDNEPDEGEEDPFAEERAKLNAEAKKHRLRAKALAKQLREKESGKGNSEKALRQRDELRVENAVLREALKHQVDPDFLELKLKKAGLLELDEDGQLDDDFEDEAAQIAKEMNTRPDAPTSPKLSGRKKGNAQDSDMSVLAKKYPSLLSRRGGL